MATFSQHHVDGLDLALTPLQAMMRMFPNVKDEPLRCRFAEYPWVSDLPSLNCAVCCYILVHALFCPDNTSPCPAVLAPPLLCSVVWSVVQSLTSGLWHGQHCSQPLNACCLVVNAHPPVAECAPTRCAGRTSGPLASAASCACSRCTRSAAVR